MGITRPIQMREKTDANIFETNAIATSLAGFLFIEKKRTRNK